MLKNLWCRVLFFFQLSGVVCRGRSPNDKETMGWLKMGRPLHYHKCLICKEEFWSWKKKAEYCGQFECFKKLREISKRT